MNKKFQFITNKKILKEPSDKVLAKIEKIKQILQKHEKHLISFHNCYDKNTISSKTICKTFSATKSILKQIERFIKSDFHKLPNATRLLDVDIENDMKNLIDSVKLEIQQILDQPQKHKSRHPHITNEMKDWHE